MADRELIPLGGRTWTPAEVTTARHDDWVMLQVAEAGLDTVGESSPAGGPAGGVAAREILSRAIASGKLDHLLAGLLLEVDAAGAPIAWTTERAMRAAEMFGALTDPEEKRRRRDLLVRLLLPFFLPGLGFSGRSPSSSTAPESGSAVPTDRPSASVNGAMSSAP